MNANMQQNKIQTLECIDKCQACNQTLRVQGSACAMLMGTSAVPRM